MKEVIVLKALRQASLSEVGQVFQEEKRSIIKERFISLMFEEAKSDRKVIGILFFEDFS